MKSHSYKQPAERRLSVGDARVREKGSHWEDYYSSLKHMPKRLRETAKFVVDAVPAMQNHKFRNALDLGCGTGRHCVLLAHSGFEVVGTDVSKSALRMAKKWILKEKLRNVMFVQASMTNLPFNEYSFDVVISVSVIHHALKKDIVTTVKEIFRILSKNGWLLANVASTADPRYGNGKKLEHNTFQIVEAFEQKRFTELHHFFTKPELLKLLHSFSNKRVSGMKDKPNYWKVSATK